MRVRLCGTRIVQQGFKNQRLGIIYATPQLAVAGAASGDNIQVLPGIYSGSLAVSIPLAQLSFTALVAGSLPVMDWAGYDKAIFVRTHAGAGSLTLDGLDLHGYIGPDGNESAVHEENHSGIYTFTCRNSIVSQCGTGLLVGNNNSDIVVLERLILTDNGDGSGSTHNVYVGNVARLDAIGVYSTSCDGGHLFKSRAFKNTLDAVYLYGGINVDCARELELPCGGDNLCRSVIIHQTADISGGSNNEMASNANEGAGTLAANCDLTGRTQGITYIQCTLANERASATFWTNGGTGITAPTQTRTDCVAAGTSAPVVAGNTNGALGILVDAANGDYRLVTPVLGSGANAPWEYVHPADYRARTDAYRGAVAHTAADPAWITTPLGDPPTLNQAIRAGADTYANHSTAHFEGNISSIIGDFGPPLVCDAAGNVYIFNGGHAGTDNNSVIKFPSSDNAPVFTLAGAASPSGARHDAVAYFDDGKPNPPHSYDQNIYHDLLGRLLLIRRSFVALSTSGTTFEHVDGFDPLTGNWDAAGTWADVPGATGESETPTCQDDVGNVYCLKGAGLYKGTYSPGTLTWSATRVNTDGSDSRGSVIKFDKVRRRIVNWGANGYTRAPRYALESEGYATWHTLTLSGAPGNTNTDIWSVCYDEYVDCFWITDDYVNRASYRKVTFTNTTPTSGATVSAAGVFSGVTFSSAGSPNNVGFWGACVFCKARRGVFMMAGTGEGLYFVRTSNPP